MRHSCEESVCIGSEGDIITVRKTVRDVATSLGFGVTDVTRIVTAVSELTRNILCFAGSGVMVLNILDKDGGAGIELIFEDKGPGIPDIELAMKVGYTSGGGLGLGLPGAKRLMDEMEIYSEINKGTTVIVRKWLRSG